eukprot:GHVQ01042762.1.p1 GENE.GHVQ01042762.1~~GHVQ01042762.1.p1  ORF type:complete len:1806 (-),score=227.09 GHVQ01042762.1:7916-13333(-)
MTIPGSDHSHSPDIPRPIDDVPRALGPFSRSMDVSVPTEKGRLSVNSSDSCHRDTNGNFQASFSGVDSSCWCTSSTSSSPSLSSDSIKLQSPTSLGPSMTPCLSDGSVHNLSDCAPKEAITSTGSANNGSLVVPLLVSQRGELLSQPSSSTCGSEDKRPISDQTGGCAATVSRFADSVSSSVGEQCRDQPASPVPSSTDRPWWCCCNPSNPLNQSLTNCDSSQLTVVASRRRPAGDTCSGVLDSSSGGQSVNCFHCVTMRIADLTLTHLTRCVQVEITPCNPSTDADSSSGVRCQNDDSSTVTTVGRLANEAQTTPSSPYAINDTHMENLRSLCYAGIVGLAELSQWCKNQGGIISTSSRSLHGSRDGETDGPRRDTTKAKRPDSINEYADILDSDLFCGAVESRGISVSTEDLRRQDVYLKQSEHVAFSYDSGNHGDPLLERCSANRAESQQLSSPAHTSTVVTKTSDDFHSLEMGRLVSLLLLSPHQLSTTFHLDRIRSATSMADLHPYRLIFCSYLHRLALCQYFHCSKCSPNSPSPFHPMEGSPTNRSATSSSLSSDISFPCKAADHSSSIEAITRPLPLPCCLWFLFLELHSQFVSLTEQSDVCQNEAAFRHPSAPVVPITPPDFKHFAPYAEKGTTSPSRIFPSRTTANGSVQHGLLESNKGLSLPEALLLSSPTIRSLTECVGAPHIPGGCRYTPESSSSTGSVATEIREPHERVGEYDNSRHATEGDVSKHPQRLARQPSCMDRLPTPSSVLRLSVVNKDNILQTYNPPVISFSELAYSTAHCGPSYSTTEASSHGSAPALYADAAIGTSEPSSPSCALSSHTDSSLPPDRYLHPSSPAVLCPNNPHGKRFCYPPRNNNSIDFESIPHSPASYVSNIPVGHSNLHSPVYSESISTSESLCDYRRHTQGGATLSHWQHGPEPPRRRKGYWKHVGTSDVGGRSTVYSNCDFNAYPVSVSQGPYLYSSTRHKEDKRGWECYGRVDVGARLKKVKMQDPIPKDVNTQQMKCATKLDKCSSDIGSSGRVQSLSSCLSKFYNSTINNQAETSGCIVTPGSVPSSSTLISTLSVDPSPPLLATDTPTSSTEGSLPPSMVPFCEDLHDQINKLDEAVPWSKFDHHQRAHTHPMPGVFYRVRDLAWCTFWVNKQTGRRQWKTFATGRNGGFEAARRKAIFARVFGKENMDGLVEMQESTKCQADSKTNPVDEEHEGNSANHEGTPSLPTASSEIANDNDKRVSDGGEDRQGGLSSGCASLILEKQSTEPDSERDHVKQESIERAEGHIEPFDKSTDDESYDGDVMADNSNIDTGSLTNPTNASHGTGITVASTVNETELCADMGASDSCATTANGIEPGQCSLKTISSENMLSEDRRIDGAAGSPRGECSDSLTERKESNQHGTGEESEGLVTTPGNCAGGVTGIRPEDSSEDFQSTMSERAETNSESRRGEGFQNFPASTDNAKYIRDLLATLAETASRASGTARGQLYKGSSDESVDCRQDHETQGHKQGNVEREEWVHHPTGVCDEKEEGHRRIGQGRARRSCKQKNYAVKLSNRDYWSEEEDSGGSTGNDSRLGCEEDKRVVVKEEERGGVYQGRNDKEQSQAVKHDATDRSSESYDNCTQRSSFDGMQYILSTPFNYTPHSSTNYYSTSSSLSASLFAFCNTSTSSPHVDVSAGYYESPSGGSATDMVTLSCSQPVTTAQPCRGSIAGIESIPGVYYESARDSWTVQWWEHGLRKAKRFKLKSKSYVERVAVHCEAAAFRREKERLWPDENKSKSEMKRLLVNESLHGVDMCVVNPLCEDR